MTLYKNRNNEYIVKVEYENGQITSGKLYLTIFPLIGTTELLSLTFLITSYPQTIDILASDISDLDAGSYRFEMDVKVNDKVFAVDGGSLTIEGRNEITN